MGKIRTVIMYLLWTLTIICVLATTFTNFQYFDLNVIAIALLLFALLNGFFTSKF